MTVTPDTQGPAVRRLLQMPGVCALTTDTVDAFIAQGFTALFFTGNAARYPEITDLATVLPELMKEFRNAFPVGVVDPDVERKLAVRFKISLRPTLVLLSDGNVLTSLGRLRDWAVYLDEIALALNAVAEETK